MPTLVVLPPMQRVLDGLRREEYTGDRRCWPCTAVNAALLAVASVVVGTVVAWPVAVLLGAVGAVVVALRGYLVPYTPRFAPRLVAPLPVDFGHGDERVGDGSVAATERDGEAVLATLVEAGVVVPEGEVLDLHPEFRTDWWAEIAALRDADDATLARAAREAAPEAGHAEVVEEDDRQFVVLASDAAETALGTWLNRPVALAEVGAVRALTAAGLAREDATAAATPLRTFLDRCPVCEAPAVETTADSCCGGPTNPREGVERILACESCDSRLATLPDEPPRADG